MTQRLLQVVQLCLAHHTAVTLIFVAVMVLGAYPNYKVSTKLQRGPIDNALPQGDPWRAWQETVEQIPGFRTGELVLVGYVLDKHELQDNEAFKKALWKIIFLEERINTIPGITVIGLTTPQEYVEECFDEKPVSFCRVDGVPYLTARDLAFDFDRKAWQERIRQNQSAWGILTCKNFACFVFGVKSEYKNKDEIWLVNQVAAILEERESYTWWERALWKTDIYPKDPHIHVVGYPQLRWHVGGNTLRWDLISKPMLGVVAASFGFFIFLRSIRQTLIAVFVAIMGGIWLTRIAVWGLSFPIPAMGEDVYTTLDYAMIIVFGLGFSLRLFYAFRKTDAASSIEKFLGAASDIYTWIFLIALISIGPFFISMPLTLSVWQMVQLGLICSISIGGIGFVLVPLVTPAAYLTLEKWWKAEPEHLRTWEVKEQWAIVRVLGSFVRAFLVWLPMHVHPALSLLLVVGVSGATAYLYSTGEIAFSTRPVDYIQGTLFERSSRKLESLGYGNNILPLHVGPHAAAADAWRLLNDLRDGTFGQWQRERFGNDIPIIQVASVLDNAAQIARISYGIPFPTNAAELSDTLFLVEGGVEDRSISQWLWSRDGFRFLVLLVTNDSAEFRHLITRILAYAEENHPTLRVVPFEKGVAFPQVDWLVTSGEGANVPSAFGILLLCYAVVLWKKNGARERYRVQPLGGAAAIVTAFLFSTGCLGIVMWWWEIPLSMASAPIAELCVGSASDLGLFLVAAYMTFLKAGREPKDAMRDALAAEGVLLIMDCILNSIAFAPLWISSFTPVRQVGMMMTGMLYACGLAILAFSPRLLVLCTTLNPEWKEEITYVSSVEPVGYRVVSLSK